MSETFSKPLTQYWFLEVISDRDFRELLIVNDIVHVLQACGYPEELAMDKAIEVFYNLELWRLL
jgi:hypothetical protein